MATSQPVGVAKRFELRHDQRFAFVAKTAEAAEPGDHGFVTGWAIVSKIRNAAGVYEEYFDLQGEHVPEDVAERAGMDFMRAGGDGKLMHGGEVVGRIVESIFVSAEKSAALGLGAPPQTGLVISFAPATAEVKQRFLEGGDIDMYSIGGEGYVVEEDVPA